MDLSGIPTAPPAGVGVAPNLSSPSSDVPSVTTIRTAARDLPSPTFSPRQIDVMERILRNEVPEDEIDALLNSVGLEFNSLTDYIAERPPSPARPPTPALTAQQIDVMERIARGNFRPGQIEELLRSAGLTKDQLRHYVINRPATPRTPSQPRAPRGRGRGRGGVPPGGGGGGDDDGGPPGGAGGGRGGGGRRGRGRGRGRGTPPRRRARMNQDELRRQMDLLAEDARQRSVGRRIAGITHTNTVTTVYKDGGEPEVYRTSSRLSTPNTV